MIPPHATIGILGGGQLGRMLAVAARQLGYGVAVYTPPGDVPARAVADTVVEEGWDNAAALARFAGQCAVVTYEFENVPVATVTEVARHSRVFPSAALLGHTQDRLAEHALLDRLGIGHASGRAVRTPADLDAAVEELGFPSRLKTVRGGYDGGGQWTMRTSADLARARVAVGGETLFRFERDVPFDREMSVILARSATGQIAVFPIFENTHEGGILRRSVWPAAIPDAVARAARALAVRIAEAVELVGTLTVECFVVGELILVNELAPRVHNSGHLTIEACSVSQFEQHLRAICGLPLAEPVARAAACMVNVLGDKARDHVVFDLSGALAQEEVHVHLYGKQQVRPRRKMGHITALSPSREAAVARAEAALARVRFG